MSWSSFRDARTRAEWRTKLFQDQGRLCALCGFRMPDDGELSADLEKAYGATFDHRIPRSRGGTDELENLRLVHALCNFRRGDDSAPRPLPPAPRVLRL